MRNTRAKQNAHAIMNVKKTAKQVKPKIVNVMESPASVKMGNLVTKFFKQTTSDCIMKGLLAT